jgi:hypothetical protein
MDSGDTGERWLRRIERGLTDLEEQVDAVNTSVENLTALTTNGFNKTLADADLRARQTTKQAWLAFAVGTCGCRKLVRARDLGFRGRDPIFAMPSVGPELAGLGPTRRSLKPRILRNGSIRE